MPAEGRSGNSAGFPVVERQALHQQQGRAQVAEPCQQPEQRRLVDQRAVQFRRAVIRVGDEAPPAEAMVIEPGAKKVESRLTRLARELHDVETLPFRNPQP